MANITLLGASYTDVPAVDLPKTGGGTVRFYENGGAPSQTQHTIYFEFSDGTDTTLTGYWDDSFISEAILATSPSTYGQKTVNLAQLDNVTWYERPTETWETIYNSTTNIISDSPYNYFWISSLTDVYPADGSVWRITVNGTTYRCTAVNFPSYNLVLIGNPKYSGGADDGSGVPFNFYNGGWGAWAGDTELSGVISLKIERLVTT